MHTVLTPYINFKNNARDAMDFYKSIFGGDVRVMTFADMGVPSPNPDGIMHIQLDIDGSPYIMGSEANGDEHDYRGMSLALSGKDADQLREQYHKLSDGGQILQQLTKASWGDEFGMFVDKFGITWMINIGSTDMGK